MTPRFQGDLDATIRRQAAEWMVRRDRGLSAGESIEFELWLADDERHAAAIQQSRAAWTLLDQLPEPIARATTQRAARYRRICQTALWSGLAAAAAFAVALSPLAQSTATAPATERRPTHDPGWESPQIVTLSDGTQVRLNTGSEVLEQYTAGERRVELVRGEAHFHVVKVPARPFIVRAGTVEARAVGTAFNVNLQSAAVEILVTEGTVAVSGGASAFAAARDSEAAQPGGLSRVGSVPVAATAATAPLRSDLLLTARQRAVVALAPMASDAAVVVTALSQDEVTRELAWQEPLLRLSGATLRDLAREFQRRTGYRLILADPHLGDLRTGGRFRGDDVEGFLRILEANYGITSATDADGGIVLRHAVPSGNR